MIRSILTLLVLVALVSAGCGKKDLDRQTALTLLGGKPVEAITGEFFGENPFTALTPPNEATAIRELIAGGVLACNETDPVFGLTCRLGPNSGGMTLFQGKSSFLAGNLVPAAVTGVTQEGPNTATAQVQLSFVPSPLYSKYHSQLDTLTNNKGLLGPRPVGPRTQRSQANANFQRYDDGWRLVSIQ